MDLKDYSIEKPFGDYNLQTVRVMVIQVCFLFFVERERAPTALYDLSPKRYTIVGKGESGKEKTRPATRA